MNKALELLEKNCQWIAIGIGGLFLAWVLYAYVLTSPVVIEAGNRKLTPGNVDQWVKNTYADQLKTQIEDPSAAPRGQETTGVKEPWKRDLLGQGLRELALRPDWPGGTPGKVVDDNDGNQQIVRDVVAAQPDLPPADPLDVKSARANVNPAPVVVNGQPVQPAPGPVPGQPAQPGVAPVAAKDVTYVKLDYSIPVKKIADAFNKVHITQGIDFTSIAAIKVMRREKKADGTWSEPVEIKRIENGEDIIPLPANPQGQQMKDFLNWIEGPLANTAMLRPTFFQVFAGEGPFDPPMPLPIEEAKAANQAAREAAIAQQQAENEARRQQQQQRRSTPPGGRSGTPGGPGMEEPGVPRGRTPRPLVDDPQRGRQPFMQVRPPNYPPNYPPPVPEDVPGFMEPGIGRPAQPVAPGQGQPPADPLPPPIFQPSNAQDTILSWTFDTSVEEGKTYQYQVLYALKNPVYTANTNVATPEISKVFSIWSKLDDNAWSNEVTVEPSTYFFLAQPNWRPEGLPQAIRVEIFKWAAGKWQSTIVAAVAPGDTIGATLTQPINFATNYTLVDVRFDERLQRPYAMVLGPSGEIIEREPKADRENEVRAALNWLVQQSRMAEPNTAANAVGAVPGAMFDR